MKHELTTIAAAALLAAAVSVPRPAVAAEDPAAAYKAHCAKCHGETGLADTVQGEKLKAAKLAGDGKVAKMTQEEVVASVKENKKHKTFSGKLSAEQIGAASAWAKELAGKK